MPEVSDEPLRYEAQLASHPLSVAVARALISAMQGWIPDDQLERARVIVSEVVTNAIRHGQPSKEGMVGLELVVTRSTLEGCVTDAGPAFEASRKLPRTDQVGGFGLHIVEQLANSWAVEHRPNGKAVRFSV